MGKPKITSILFGWWLSKNGYELLGLGTPAVSQEWIDEVNWFFAC